LHLTHLHDCFVSPVRPFLAQVISGSGLNISGVSSAPGSTLPASAALNTLVATSMAAISTGPNLRIPTDSSPARDHKGTPIARARRLKPLLIGEAFAIKPRRSRLILRTTIGPRGGVVTQRTANPCTPVRFRAWPPLFQGLGIKNLAALIGDVILPPANNRSESDRPSARVVAVLFGVFRFFRIGGLIL
jgi:hypothetical protein